MSRRPAVLALDQGTTGSTALVLDWKGRVMGRGYAELPQHFPRAGWVEHEPEEIWSSTLLAARQALRTSKTPGRSIAAIGITNQRETAVLRDERSSGRTGARPSAARS
jgi:glycerol kinase